MDEDNRYDSENPPTNPDDGNVPQGMLYTSTPDYPPDPDANVRMDDPNAMVDPNDPSGQLDPRSTSTPDYAPDDPNAMVDPNDPNGQLDPRSTSTPDYAPDDPNSGGILDGENTISPPPGGGVRTPGGTPPQGGTQPGPNQPRVIASWQSGLKIDADGDVRAYHPTDDNQALDNLESAGRPPKGGGRRSPLKDWEWWAVVTRVPESRPGTPGNEPVVQGPNDPAPGFLVSATRLAVDDRLPEHNPLRYFQSSQVPYMVSPTSQVPQLLGKRGRVTLLRTGVSVDVIVADSGGAPGHGEVSIAAAQALGLPGDAKGRTPLPPELRKLGLREGQHGALDDGVLYEVFG